MPTLVAPIAREPRDALPDVVAAVGVREVREVLARLVGIAAAEAPEEVGRDRRVALGCEPLAHAEQLRRDAVALHHDDHARPRRRGRGRRHEERDGDVTHFGATYPADWRRRSAGPECEEVALG